MQKAIKTLIYFIIGVFLFMILSIFLMGFFGSHDKKVSPEVQYVEVTGKKGEVRIHIGMIKDSVQILLGKPDQISIRSLGNSIYEDWKYIKNKHDGPYLNIDFENGEIKEVQKY